MPLLAIRCAQEHTTEAYVALAAYIEGQGYPTPPCTLCGEPTRQVPLSNTTRKSRVFPFVTPHIRGDGQPMVIEDMQHLRKVEKEYGVVLPAFAQNEHDLDPIKDPPVYKGYDLHGDTAYRSADPDRQAWARRRKS